MKTIYVLLLFALCTSAIAQNTHLLISPFVQQPKDSSSKKALISSLSKFLKASDSPNEFNVWIYPSQRVETFVLLDEINAQSYSRQLKKDSVYSPELLNVSTLNDSMYWLQFAYTSKTPSIQTIRAVFELMAYKSSDSFLFASPLVYNTQNWKVSHFGNIKIHHQTELSKPKLKDYLGYKKLYDGKLGSLPDSKINSSITEYYCCRDIFELQKLLGISYKMDFADRSKAVLSSSHGNRKVVVLGNNNSDFSQMDSHDLWHERLGMLIPRNQVNHSVDEGCAYLYGGSWGLSWKAIFTAFNTNVASNPDTNWLDMKTGSRFFKTGEFYNNPDYIVTALIIKQVEKNHGFSGVWELMLARDKEEYFKVLEKLTGINKVNYNERVKGLIEEERRVLKLKAEG